MRHREVMGESLMDMLRALATPNMDIRKKTLDIALDLITSRNIDEARFAHLARACPASRVHDVKFKLCVFSTIGAEQLASTADRSQWGPQVELFWWILGLLCLL